jgi:hypothetical protein
LAALELSAEARPRLSVRGRSARLPGSSLLLANPATGSASKPPWLRGICRLQGGWPKVPPEEPDPCARLAAARGLVPAQLDAGVPTVPQRRANAVVWTPAATALLLVHSTSQSRVRAEPFLSHRSGSAHVCRSSLTELNDDPAVRTRIVEDTVSVPVTAAGASRSGSSTAESGRLGRLAPIVRTSGEIGVEEGGCAITRATARCAGATVHAGSKLTGDSPTAAAADGRDCRGSAVRTPQEPRGWRAALGLAGTTAAGI